MIGGTRNRKGEYQWCGNELYDRNCNLKRYSWQLTVWEKQKIIQALQYNSITVSINHIFALVLRKCHTEHTENTEKIKVKETLWGRCSSAFSSLIYLLWYALGLYCQERIMKNYAKLEIKISIIKLNKIKYCIKNCQNSCISGVSCCIFVFQAEDDFKNKKETFKPKIKQITQQLKCCLCLQNQQIPMLSDPDRKSSISRSLLVRFSLTSR